MPEDTTITPVQPDPTPVQPAPVTTATPAAAENWRERYAGQQKALQLAVESKKSLDDQLLAKASELEQLRAQLTLKDTEKTIAVGERDKQMEVLLTESQSKEAELTRLRALELKIKVATELGKPELMQIAEHIPDIQDEEILKSVMGDFAKFTDTQVKAREEQLMAGISPTTVAASPSPAAPSTVQDWEDRIDELAFGSKERQQALDSYGDFLEASHNIKP